MSTQIVDVHSHWWAEEWLPEPYWDALVDIVCREHEKGGRDPDPDYVRENYLPSYWDPSGEHLLERMDEAGIDHQVVFGLDWGIPLGDPPLDIREYNRKVADLAADNPGRITGFVTVDPRRSFAVEHVEEAIEDWGMGGLKLHPTSGFHLHDAATYRLLDVAADNDVPVLTDSGPIAAPLYSKYSHPNHVDEVITDFPDLNLVVAHMSLGWWRQLLAIAETNINTNVHVDISGWQFRAEEHPDEFAEAVRRFVDALGADRVLWGTDDPVFDPAAPKEEWIAATRALADRETGATFTDEEVETILGGASAALLDL
ncbi:MAG: amidohydrolase family protein [Haloarculaceae archaeon]